MIDGYAKSEQAVRENDANNTMRLDLVDVVFSACMAHRQQWPAPGVVLQYLLSNQAFETDITDQELTLSQCLELDEALPAVTAKELAGPNAALMAFEQAECYVAYYMMPQKNCSKIAKAPKQLGSGSRLENLPYLRSGARPESNLHQQLTDLEETQKRLELELGQNAIMRQQMRNRILQEQASQEAHTQPPPVLPCRRSCPEPELAGDTTVPCYQLPVAPYPSASPNTPRRPVLRSQHSNKQNDQDYIPQAAYRSDAGGLTVTLTQPGSLGIKLQHIQGQGMEVLEVSPGTQAESPELRAGLMLTEVGGESLVGASYEQAWGVIKSAGRPIKLEFKGTECAALWIV